MKVYNELKVYELNGKEVPLSDSPNIAVESHWNRSEYVVLILPCDDKVYRKTVLAADLKRAIENATNHK
jgi:hypothetical protein